MKGKLSKREQHRLIALYEQGLSDEDRRLATQGELESVDDPLGELAWYILQVSPMCEAAVGRRLRRRIVGVHPFVAVAKDSARRRHQRVTVERVVFARYLFVGFEQEPPWLFVRETMGVRGIFAVDGVPYRIGAEVVGEVMSRCATGFYDRRSPGKVQVGMRVVAEGGRHRGAVGEVTAIDKSSGVAEVLFEVFGRDVPARLTLDDLVSVAYASSARMIG